LEIVVQALAGVPVAATDQSGATVSLQTTPSGDTTVTLEVSIGGALAVLVAEL